MNPTSNETTDPTTQRPPRVAYFCMEYGLSDEFPIYSGGLGVLAGDFIKSAGDLGLPVVGIGLRWEAGTAQFIGSEEKPEDRWIDTAPTFSWIPGSGSGSGSARRKWSAWSGR